MSRNVADFHYLTERYRLSGTLTTRTALRIGSGSTGDLEIIDLPVLKDADGFPIIPGASLKGAVRTTVEALVRGASKPNIVWACDPLAGAPDDGDDEDAPADPYRIPGCGNHKHGKRADVMSNINNHCTVCQLFGSHLVASHVRFCDAMLRIPPDDYLRGRIPLEIRDGVSIDRDLRRAAGKRKYDFEVVSPGTAFSVEVFIENPKPWLMGLLMMGFEQIAEGFTALGGFTSRGLGRVDLTWATLTKVTAADLLSGRPSIPLDGDSLKREVSAWHAALATVYQGAA